MSIRYQTELPRRRRRAIRARVRSGVRESDLQEQGLDHGVLVEYRGRESYEQQSSEGRGGQSGMFDQRDYPPRTSVQGEAPPEDDGQLVPPQDQRLS